MKRRDKNQMSLADYSLPEVKVTLKLSEGERLYSTTPMTNPDAAVRVMSDLLKQMDREYVCVVSLNNALQPMAWNIVSVGGINASLVPIGNVFKTALLQNAADVMLFHNHPSGNLSPSEEDKKLTERLVEAGNLLEIPVIDHIIIGAGEGETCSLRIQYPELFSKEITLAYKPEETHIEFFVAECMEFHGAGEYREGLTLEDAVETYKRIPEDRMHAGKGIGMILHDGSIYDGPVDLMQSGKILWESVNCVQHFRDSFSVQLALRQLSTAIDQFEVHEKGVAYQTRRDKVKELTDKLEKGVQDVFASGRYKEWLYTAAKLHHYSVNNQILIMMQKPNASMVAGYQAWANKFHRHVNQGEKGIAILSPVPYQKHVTEKDPDTGEEKDKTIAALSFKPAYVWDVSQTSGKEIPSLVTELKGGVEGYKDLLEAVRRISPVPISFEEMQGEAKGYYSDTEKKIVIKQGMEQAQTIKTVLHEVSHARLASSDRESQKDRGTREVEAESSAFITASALGLDTSEYSFGYVAGWSSGRDTKELKASMETIRQNSSEMIDQIQENLQVIQKEHEQERFEELAQDIDREMTERMPERAERSQDKNQDETRRALKENPKEVKSWLESQHDDRTDKLAERVAVICAAGIVAKVVIKPEIKQENVQGLTM